MLFSCFFSESVPAWGMSFLYEKRGSGKFAMPAPMRFPEMAHPWPLRVLIKYGRLVRIMEMSPDIIPVALAGPGFGQLRHVIKVKEIHGSGFQAGPGFTADNPAYEHDFIGMEKRQRKQSRRMKDLGGWVGIQAGKRK
jgi:hypothetical protein